MCYLDNAAIAVRHVFAVAMSEFFRYAHEVLNKDFSHDYNDFMAVSYTHLYGRDEETNYYFYTALLHGGLSADSWASLWDRSLLPLARGIAKGDSGFCGEMDGHSILSCLLYTSRCV